MKKSGGRKLLKGQNTVWIIQFGRKILFNILSICLLVVKKPHYADVLFRNKRTKQMIISEISYAVTYLNNNKNQERDTSFSPALASQYLHT